jgi:hypothetical protein
MNLLQNRIAQQRDTIKFIPNAKVYHPHQTVLEAFQVLHQLEEGRKWIVLKFTEISGVNCETNLII